MAIRARGPSFAPRSPLRQALADYVPNLLVTTLAVVVATVPFSQTEWSQPIRPAVRLQGAEIPNVTLPLSGGGMLIRTPTDQAIWRIPQRFTRLDQVRTVPNLLTSTLWIEDVPRVAYLQPRPYLRGVAAQDPPNLLTGTLGVPVEIPFAQADWPVPARVQVRAQGSGEIPNLLTTLLWPGTPFTELDWPRPPLRPPSVSDEPVPNLLLDLNQEPFSQTEWPAFSRQLTRVVTEGPPNLPQTTLYAGTPFSQALWAAARVPQYLELPDPLNLLETTLAFTGAAPFRQTDWPPPLVRTASAIGAELPPNLVVGGLAIPFTPQERLIYQVRPPRTILDPPPNLLSATLNPGVGATPFHQNAWVLVPPRLLYQHDFVPNQLPLQSAPPLVLVQRDLFTLGTELSFVIGPDGTLGGRGGF